jgi:hypothetical protein
MSDQVRLTGGTFVYLRDKSGNPVMTRRGKIVSAINPFTQAISVEWEDGVTQQITVRSLIAEVQVKKEIQAKKDEEKAMNMKDLAPGTVVYRADGDDLVKGTVVGPAAPHPTHGEMVAVEWENGSIIKTAPKLLMLEKDGLAELARRDAEAAKLEEEFATVEAEVHNKMRQAGKLIKEAAEIAEKAGLHLLGEYGATEEFSDAVDELESAMEKAGWRTSSWYC